MATLFALAAFAPVAMAHNTNDGSVPYIQPILNGCGVEAEVGATNELPCVAPHIDTDRWGPGHVTGVVGAIGSGGNAANGAGVAGRYVGSTGPLLDIAGSETQEQISVNNVNLLPIQIFGVITTLCDAEATTGPSVPNPNPGDEVVVDNAPGGSVPDGTWDDGGIAGACHVATYDHTAYNDPGCPSGDYAVAEDAVLGESVEIGAGCDMLTSVSGGGPDPLGGVTCAINALIFDGHNITDQPTPVLDCLLPRVSCVLNPATCATPVETACGSDGTTDVIAFGEGGGHATPTNNGEDGVQYPAPPQDSLGNTCLNTIGSAQVYTILGARAEIPAVTTPIAITIPAPPALPTVTGGTPTGITDVGVSISVPTVGWIDEVGASALQGTALSCTGVGTAASLCTYTAPGCVWVYIWSSATNPHWTTISKTETPAGACGPTPPGPT